MITNKRQSPTSYIKGMWEENIKNDNPKVFEKYFDKKKFALMKKSADTLGTPQYVLDEAALRKRARFFLGTFGKHMSNVHAFYAFKCNDFPWIVKTLREEGFNADVAGLFELQLALKLGFKSIIFTSPGKSEKELLVAIKNAGKVIINIDNEDELLLLKAVLQQHLKAHKMSKPVRISFRVNPQPSKANTWSKFGIELKDFKKVLRHLKNKDVENKYISFVGIQFHSSWNKHPEKYVQNIRIIGEYLKKEFTADEITRLTFLDIGGGYFPEDTAIINKIQDKGILIEAIKETYGLKGEDNLFNFDPYAFEQRKVEPLEVFAKEISQSLREHILPLHPHIEIFMEPGRFIATHSTSILLRVIAKKGENVIVDGGINMVGDYRFEEFSFAPIINLSQFSASYKKATIFGPLCDPSDLWGYHYYGKGIKKGDVLAVLHQGAYTFPFAWKFIKPLAQYVVMKDGKLILGKKEESFAQRYEGCSF